MEPTARHDEDDDFDGLEAALKSLRPRAPSDRLAGEVATESLLAALTPKGPSADFAGNVALESTLAGLAPKALPEGFADRVVAESALRAVSPAGLPEGFSERVATEIALAGLRPRALPEGYAERVMDACLAGERRKGIVIPFRRILVPLSAAAVLGLAVLPFVRRDGKTVAPAIAVASTSPATEPLDASGVSLPVVTLPDGRAYRPVIRNRYAQPVDFRAGPCGVVPVSAPASGTGVDYEPVMYE